MYVLHAIVKMSNSSQEVIEIGDKFKSSSELLKNIESNLSNVTNVEGKDKEAHEALPVVVGRLSQLSAEWYQQWAKILLETGADLGTITSYVGSVFKPQEIPVAQMILCVVSDMEMASLNFRHYHLYNCSYCRK